VRDLTGAAEELLRDLNRARRGTKVSLPLAFECVDYAARAGAFRSPSAAARAKRRISGTA
jgi:hypothetical protein